MSDPDQLAETAHPLADAAPDNDLTGRQFGDYRLLRRLGRGAMAEVYLAEQTSLKRQVAFKVLKSHLAHDETYVQRFHLEAQAAASLVHANIVAIHEVGASGGVHYIVQEYVQGLNLHELMVRRGPPDLKMAIGIMRQVAAALHKAARHGIVHRDIKPENIMLAATGEVKVADFGLARVASEDAAVNLTQVGFTMGTPLYMSPEQVEGKLLDPRSDIYSLGVTCYHMLAGEAPFRGDTALSVAVQHLKATPLRLESLRPDLPPGVCRIVHKMLAKNPNDRYASARELMRDLRALPLLGMVDDDNAELEGWADEEFGPLADSRMLATQRLAAVMQAPSSRAVGLRRWGLFAIGTLAAFGVGAALAYGTREKPLIAPGPPDTRVDRKATAEAQFMYALMADTEDAWNSVALYFPQNEYYIRRAKQQLARWYLERDDYDQAKTIFDEFTSQGKDEPRFYAFGLAGQTIVLGLQDQPQAAADKLAELWEYQQYLDGEMRGMIGQLIGKNRRNLSPRALEKWEQLPELRPMRPQRGPDQPPTQRPSNPDDRRRGT